MTFYLLSDGERTAFSRLFDLELPESDSLTRWQKASPALNAHRIHTPLLINAAEAEYIADMQLVITLRELKKPVEMFISPNEQHLKNQPKHRYEIYERNVDWFNFWLQNKEDPHPAKIEQYKRWHVDSVSYRTTTTLRRQPRHNLRRIRSPVSLRALLVGNKNWPKS